jgi:hypothetical protein
MIIHSKKLLGATDHGVFEYKVPGTYTLTFKRKTRATVYMVGAGGASGWQMVHLFNDEYTYFSGGSGAVFIGDIYIPEGTLTIKVGSKTNNMNTNAHTIISSNVVSGNLITAGGAGYTEVVEEGFYSYGGFSGGLLNVSINADVIEGSVIINSMGNSGAGSSDTKAKAGAASLYNGYGRGADYLNGQGKNVGLTNATNGYFKIVY